MKIKREVVTSIMIDDSSKLSIGDTVKFFANNTCNFGTFVGVTKRGSLEFEANVDGVWFKFKVMPKSIDEIEVIEHGTE